METMIEKLKDIQCQLDLMIEGYFYNAHSGLTTLQMEEQLRIKSIELRDAIDIIENYINNKDGKK